MIGGAAGLGRIIRHVNVMEVPDILPFVREHELLLTTAYPLRDRPAALVELVPQLAERDLAALAIVPRAYVGAVPAGALTRADELAFPVIELPENTSFNDILSDVLEVILNRQAVQLERSQAIHERLTAVVLGGGSLAQLMETLAELLRKAVAITDAHGQLLASSQAGREAAADRERVVRPIRIGGSKLGEIVVWARPEAVGPEDLMAIDQAATIAALQMAQARAVLSREQRYQAVLLDELVSGRLERDGGLIDHAAALGWNLRIPRAAIVVELRERGSGREIPVAGQPLEDRLLHLVRSCLGEEAIAWARRSGLALLVDARDAAGPGTAAHRLGEELRRQLPGTDASLGVGRPAEEVGALHASYREASQALAVGRDLEGPDGVAEFDALGFYRLIHPLAASPELERYCQDLLGRITAYDTEHGTELLATLESYLRNGRNAAATARDLFIHYNTLRYRLEKLDRLTGGLDRQANSRLSIEVALHARRLLKAPEKPTARAPRPTRRRVSARSR